MITNSKRSLILKLSFRRILKVVSQLNKPQIFLKYCFSRERQFEFTNPRFGNCVNSSKYINTCVLNTFIFILTGQRLFWYLPSTFSYCETGTYQKILAMEIHILSRNFSQIRQSSSKYFLHLWVSESNNSDLVGTVWPWLQFLATSCWKIGCLKFVFSSPEKLKLLRWWKQDYV